MTAHTTNSIDGRATRHHALQATIGAAILLLGATSVQSQEVPFALEINRGESLEISWPSRAGFIYELQFSTNLSQDGWTSLSADLPGTGETIKVTDEFTSGSGRYYRAIETASANDQISPEAILPEPGAIYPAGTAFGSPVLGLQYSIPAEWQGGMRVGTSTTLFASDTEPGLVLGFLTLSGDANLIAQVTSQDFNSADGYFQAKGSPTVSGNVVTAEWDLLGQGITLQLRARVHPSGGAIAFAGFFTSENRAVMERVLGDFVESTVTVPRQTRQDLVDLISGKAFTWAKSSNTGGLDGSLRSWSENNVFFCPGTYEVTTYSESSFSGNLSGGGFYSGGSSNTSTEAGDWTVIDTANGPVLLLLSAEGFQSAYLTIGNNFMRFGDQEFTYTRDHACN